MSDFRMHEQESSGELILGGDLTIANAPKIREALIRALERSAHVSVSVEDAAVMDLSFLQLLCSAHQTAVAGQKTFSIKNGHTEEMEKMVRDSGYLRTCGCSRDSTGTCLWMRRTEQ